MDTLRLTNGRCEQKPAVIFFLDLYSIRVRYPGEVMVDFYAFTVDVQIAEVIMIECTI